MFIISAERAIAEGSTPAQMETIVAWHTARADVIRKALKDGKRWALGGKISEADRQRHLQIAAELRDVVREMFAIVDAEAA